MSLTRPDDFFLYFFQRRGEEWGFDVLPETAELENREYRAGMYVDLAMAFGSPLTTGLPPHFRNSASPTATRAR